MMKRLTDVRIEEKASVLILAQLHLHLGQTQKHLHWEPVWEMTPNLQNRAPRTSFQVMFLPLVLVYNNHTHSDFVVAQV